MPFHSSLTGADLHINGPFNYTAVSSSPHNVAAENQILLVDSSGGAITVNLRAVATAEAQAWLIVTDAGEDAATNNITIDGSGAETIDGATTLVLSTNGASVLLFCDGTEWHTLAGYRHTGGVSQGAKYTTVSVASSPYTVLAEQQVLRVSTASARTINLRAAATAGDGAWLVIKDVTGSGATNNITIDGNSSETIDGSTTYVISENYGAVTIVTDGSNWYIV